MDLDGARLDIAEVARLADVTSRTLRHYDAIGLVRPAGTDGAGRRWYGRSELLRLQRVLVMRSLGLPLERIAAVLNDDVDELVALREHRADLLAEQGRLGEVLATVQRTIDHLEGRSATMSTEDVFAGVPGYDAEQQRAYESEARDRWGDAAVDAATSRAAGLTPEAARAHQREHDRIGAGLAEQSAAGADASLDAVQQLVAAHYAWVSVFWTPDAPAYGGLGQMYVDDERFRATYDAFGSGTAELLRDAIEVYARRTLG